MKISIDERAANKAFAKIIHLRDELAVLQKDIATRNTGPISIEQVKQVLNGTLIELQTWEYIFELIEKNEKS